MENHSTVPSRSLASLSRDEHTRTSRHEEINCGDDHSDGSEDSESRYSEQSERSGECESQESGRFCSEDSGTYSYASDDEEESMGSINKVGEKRCVADFKRAQSEEEYTESHTVRSDDETDTCMLSIDEHVRRRQIKATLMAVRNRRSSELKAVAAVNSYDSESEDNKSKSDDETDTCMLSIDENLRRRQAKWAAQLRNGQGTEAVDLACLDSDAGTLEETTILSVERTSEEDTAVERKTVGSGSSKNRRVTTEAAPPAQQRREESMRTEQWRIRNWRNETAPFGVTQDDQERILQGVDYMSAFELASTNRDISVVENGISKRAAREAFEKKEVPDEIPIMLRDDVSSIYPPVRAPMRPHPSKRLAPMNGMILEEPVSFDDEIGLPTKSYEMSIVGTEGKKNAMISQRSDLELILIAIISFSLLVLVILLIVILAKSG